ncbi:Gag-Pol polyprotein [Chionoecetes opilio]|uniref:Gag-Pol polyprotein n=1 Tax=Chionoecetes opilio TaxID=41210 RepID=A0A8J4Y3V4_CHIOP|nr:Gag-Pol polyprotein [Chionoecetes opilio]
MRYILGCPASTRIVNMLAELDLPPLVERIHAMSHPSATSLDPAAPRPPLRPGVRTLVNTVCSTLLRLDLNVPVAEVDHGPPPWRIPPPQVSFTPTSKAAPPLLQKQLALEHIAAVSSSVPAAPHLYVDGSLQPDGSAGCAVYSPDVAPPEGGWVGRRLPNLSSSTYCELQGLLLAVSLLCQRRLNGVVMCDSQSALQAISSPQPTHRCLVHQILLQLVAARDNSLTIRFLWIPSHVGIAANDKVDLLAKTVCSLPLPDGATPSLLCFKQLIHSAALLPTLHRTNAERAQSVSIQHYDHFRLTPPKYRRRGLMARRHNIVSARLRLGYRPVWQVSEAGDIPHFSSCKLCDRPRANSLQHYCLECPSVRDMLPQGQPLLAVCDFLLTDSNLDVVLVRHPHFGGC